MGYQGCPRTRPRPRSRGGVEGLGWEGSEGGGGPWWDSGEGEEEQEEREVGGGGEEVGVVVGVEALESLLQALSTTRSLPQIAQLQQQLLVRGLASSPFRATKLLQLYADAGDLPTALRLFAALPRPSVFAWTPILALFSRSGDHLRCIAGYAAMRSAAVTPDGYVFPSILRSSAAAAHPSAVHADAVKFGSDAVLPVRNALIDAYSKVGNAASARRVFDLTDGRDPVSAW